MNSVGFLGPVGAGVSIIYGLAADSGGSALVLEGLSYSFIKGDSYK